MPTRLPSPHPINSNQLAQNTPDRLTTSLLATLPRAPSGTIKAYHGDHERQRLTASPSNPSKTIALANLAGIKAKTSPVGQIFAAPNLKAITKSQKLEGDAFTLKSLEDSLQTPAKENAGNDAIAELRTNSEKIHQASICLDRDRKKLLMRWRAATSPQLKRNLAGLLHLNKQRRIHNNTLAAVNSDLLASHMILQQRVNSFEIQNTSTPLIANTASTSRTPRMRQVKQSIIFDNLQTPKSPKSSKSAKRGFFAKLWAGATSLPAKIGKGFSWVSSNNIANSPTKHFINQSFFQRLREKLINQPQFGIRNRSKLHAVKALDLRSAVFAYNISFQKEIE